MAGGGYGSEFHDDRARQNIAKAFEVRDAQMQQVVKCIDAHERALKWFTDEHLGRHMSKRDHFEAAAKYNGIVLGVGYAGFFGLWSIVGQQASQSPRLHALAALLIAVSLSLFVLWEVYCMFLNTVTATHPKTMGATPTRFIRCVHFCYDGLENAWVPVFLLTVATGLGGIGSLAWLLVDNLLTVLRA